MEARYSHNGAYDEWIFELRGNFVRVAPPHAERHRVSRLELTRDLYRRHVSPWIPKEPASQGHVELDRP